MLHIPSERSDLSKVSGPIRLSPTIALQAHADFINHFDVETHSDNMGARVSLTLPKGMSFKTFMDICRELWTQLACAQQEKVLELDERAPTDLVTSRLADHLKSQPGFTEPLASSKEFAILGGWMDSAKGEKVQHETRLEELGLESPSLAEFAPAYFAYTIASLGQDFLGRFSVRLKDAVVTKDWHGEGLDLLPPNAREHFSLALNLRNFFEQVPDFRNKQSTRTHSQTDQELSEKGTPAKEPQ